MLEIRGQIIFDLKRFGRNATSPLSNPAFHSSMFSRFKSPDLPHIPHPFPLRLANTNGSLNVILPRRSSLATQSDTNSTTIHITQLTTLPAQTLTSTIFLTTVSTVTAPTTLTLQQPPVAAYPIPQNGTSTVVGNWTSFLGSRSSAVASGSGSGIDLTSNQTMGTFTGSSVMVTVTASTEVQSTSGQTGYMVPVSAAAAVRRRAVLSLVAAWVGVWGVGLGG